MTSGFFWYLIPLLVAISLVYAGTRQEAMEMILAHAWRTAVWIIGFMLVIFLILLSMSWFL